MLSRRQFMQRFLAGAAGLVSLGGYAFAVEPRYRLSVARWDMALPRWPADAPPLRAALISDIHAVDPWMSNARIAQIVATTNALGADIVLLLGDYMSSLPGAKKTPPREWARELAQLRAPLGVHAILGNHDYHWHRGSAPVIAALREVGITVLLNETRRIRGHGHDFWLAGTESSLVWSGEADDFAARDDLDAALARVTDDRPIVLMAHEPAQFAEVPDRVAVTFSRHTHGGQVALPLLGRWLPHAGTGRGWVRGPYEEDGRHLLVTSGLGVSILPVRFMVPPEIALVQIGSAPSA
jgi:uncharacterized protein